MDGYGTGFHQLDGHGVETDGYGRRRLDHRSGTGRRSTPALARPVAVPRAVQPKVSVQGQAVVEADQQVLATSFHVRDAAAHQPAELSVGPAAGATDGLVQQRSTQDI